MKCTVDVLDILGLYFVMTRLLGRTEMKIMVTAVGKHSVLAFHDSSDMEYWVKDYVM